MPLYENVFIARQDATAAQVEALTDTFTAIITEQGGQVTKREYWGLRSLTYRIKKNRKGHYTLLNLDAPPAAVAEWSHVEQGKITMVRVVFDARPFTAAQPPQAQSPTRA